MDRLSMHKSSAVLFNSLSKNVADEYSSSGSYGEQDDELSSDNFAFSTGRTESQEFIVDLAPMFAQHQIPEKFDENEAFTLDIGDVEYSFEQFNCPTTPTIPFRVEPIECVVINVAHLEQFPKPPSQYSSTLPSIFAWFDAQTAFPSEYIPTVQTYFKNTYNRIRAHLRFFFSIAPSNERMNNLASIRREVPAGRILFHYIGHGFPKITSKNLWCSEKRSTNFNPFDLCQLFSRLRPPTWFIFDCSNAAAVIPTFIEEAKRQPNMNGVDWNDWFCICATDAGEDLPSDPRIPRDFLTSCILSSVKMAIICHILQNYRVSMVSHKFPMELHCQYLWADRSSDSTRLSLSLTAITDAIAADSLTPELYHKIFRCDRLSAVLFRHFLLAQFLLRPYKVHPKAYPSLPDLSMHKLWHQWSVMIDTAICAVHVPRPSFASDMFERLAMSFDQILRNNQLHLVRPYHLTILFHMFFTEQTNDRPLFLLAEYSANRNSNPKMLTAATVFHCLIQKVMQKEIRHEVFHSLCYLILVLLYHHPAFATEIRKELDITHFPWLIFKEDLPEETKILVAALLSNLVVTNETFQQICTSFDFLTSVRKELAITKPHRALWLLLLIRRSFHLFSPEPIDFIGNGLNVQCAKYIFHKASSCRAAAVSAITCFLRPFECDVNGQLLFMVLPTVFDASYLVRFHLLLLLKKFVVSFDCCSESINVPNPTFPLDSFSSMMAAFYRRQVFTKENFFNEIDDVVHTQNFIVHAYSVALFVIRLFTTDPHLSVSSLASKILTFVEKQRAAFEENYNAKRMIHGIDEDDNEQNALTNLDQNESLHQISLRNLIAKQQWKLCDEPEEKCHLSEKIMKALPPAPQTHVSSNFQMIQIYRIKIANITKIAFHRDSLGVAVSTSDDMIYYINDRQNPSSIKCRSVIDIKVVDWDGRIRIVMVSKRGDIFIWEPPRKYFSSSFRCSMHRPIIAVSQNAPYAIFTADQSNTITKWDIRSFSMVGEWQTGAQSVITSLALSPITPGVCFAGYENGVIRELKLEAQCTLLDVTLQHQNKAVTHISVSQVNRESYYAMTSDGKCDTWTNTLNTIAPLTQQTVERCREFEAHQLYPFLLFAPVGGNPFITNTAGKTLYTFKMVDKDSCCAAHPVLPVFAFGSGEKELVVYHLSQDI